MLSCAPQVLHGAAVLAYGDADASFFLAGKLGGREITADEERVIQKELKVALSMEQGTPVAVGSGKSALKYKLRATSHSIKLSCTTWKRAAEQLTRTATWVGDLGETGISKVRTNLRKVMGEWIVQSDAAADDDDFAVFGEDFMLGWTDRSHGDNRFSKPRFHTHVQAQFRHANGERWTE